MEEVIEVQVERVRMRRLAVLAHQQILRLREQRDLLEERLLQEFRERREHQNLTWDEVRLMREEMIKKYSDHTSRAQQPYMDLFVNLTIETEQEMDFPDKGAFDLDDYDDDYEWTEEHYLRLRFKALRHLASQVYHNDVYAYLVRTRPDDLERCRQTYDENHAQWVSTTAQLGELQAYAEEVLEEQFHTQRRGYYAPPPADVLIPPSRPTMASEMKPLTEGGTKPPTMVLTEPQRKPRRMSGGGISKALSASSPDGEAQKEERDAAIEAVREITGTAGGTSGQGRGQDDRSLNITGTPGYDWDAGYDGIQGFATQLRNRVSDPSTPQRRLSLRQMGEVSQGSPQRGYRTPPRAGGAQRKVK